ncbi:MAG: RagB/SusD family nutrient uptake outer membrane protein [Draconibacterium sp.]
MKKIYIIMLSLALGACSNDFMNLEPTTEFAESDAYFDTREGLEAYVNSFYAYIDYDKILEDFQSDNCEHKSIPPTIRSAYYTVPTALGSGGWNWTNLRNINYFIEKCEDSKNEQSVKHEYLAVARFFRAMFYFEKVKAFGDVPWYSTVLETNDNEELYKARDSRTLVMDSVVNDLNYAIKYLPREKYRNKASKWTALALKSRVCLYEGTWRKYHTEANVPNANGFLQQAANASRELIDASIYSLYTTGNKSKDYYELFMPYEAFTEEVIMARSFADGVKFRYTPQYTAIAYGNYGASRSLISSYAMTDGESFQDRYPDQEQRDTMSYYNEFQGRDPRLKNSVIYPGYIRIGANKVTVNHFQQNLTGYQIIKGVGPDSEDQDGSSRDIIVFRYAEVLLNYAEAKAELGSLTQADIDLTLNKIRSRVGIPALKLPIVSNDVLAGKYHGTKDPSILEVRRERRVELAFEGFRKDDLIRWAEGHLFRNAYEGIYITALHTYIDLDNNGTDDIYVVAANQPFPGNTISTVQYLKLDGNKSLTNSTNGRIVPHSSFSFKTFENWEYLQPIPLEELTLNPNLVQNKGWEEYY